MNIFIQKIVANILAIAFVLTFGVAFAQETNSAPAYPDKKEEKTTAKTKHAHKHAKKKAAKKAGAATTVAPTAPEPK